MFFFTINFQNDLSSIEAKIKRIESDLQRNHKTINLIKDTVRDIANGDTQSLTRLQKALSEQGSDLFLPGEHKGGNINQHGAKTVYNISKGNKAAAVVIAGEMCGLGDIGSSKPDVNVSSIQKSKIFDYLVPVVKNIYKIGATLCIETSYNEFQDLRI